MHRLGRFMIASNALPLAAPLAPAAAPAMVGAWAALNAAFLWSLLRSRGSLYAPNITRGDGASERIALTFDDGPRGDQTLRLLDILGQAGAKATFFVVGRRAGRQPDVIRRIASAGHTVGNHTMTHPLAWAAAGRRRVAREVAEAQDVIGSITGEAPVWFRPPMGHKNVHLRPVLQEHRLRMVTWSIRSWDTLLRRCGPVARRILRGSRPGEIVLIHEGIPGRADADALAACLTERLLRELAVRRLRPVSLSELLSSPAGDGAPTAPWTAPASASDERAR